MDCRNSEELMDLSQITQLRQLRLSLVLGDLYILLLPVPTFWLLFKARPQPYFIIYQIPIYNKGLFAVVDGSKIRGHFLVAHLQPRPENQGSGRHFLVPLYLPFPCGNNSSSLNVWMPQVPGGVLRARPAAILPCLWCTSPWDQGPGSRWVCRAGLSCTKRSSCFLCFPSSCSRFVTLL